MAELKSKFDLDLAQKLARDYTQATGVECLLINRDCIYNPCPGAIHKEFCFQKDEEIATYCLNVHASGAAAAKNRGEGVSYFCPMGLLHWSSPIVINGQIEANFIAGHVFLDDPKENITEYRQLSILHEKILRDHPELKNSLLSSLIIDNTRLASLQYILDVMAAAISDGKIITDQSTNIQHLLNKEKRRRKKQEYHNSTWQQLTESVNKNAPVEIDKNLGAIIKEVANNQSAFNDNKSDLNSFIAMLYCENENQNEPNYLADHCISALGEIQYLESNEELTAWIKKNLRGLLEASSYLPSIKNADMIYNALHYINANYKNKIILQEISDHVHFSPPYFSKIFKKELNTTFTQYLTKVRIEKSKDLLSDPFLPLADIPGMVGFEEQSYFTKVFRSITGVSPGKYREQIIS